ncbi:hypothetical protein F8388_004759 [Cannabis sativa]|uniref:WW domain-containing protein n=1 Tax=Cannabis sativa TaxID=3483 RepID=A0A7J6HPI4_CANSA|nr:hypothetical protein F8388_004759 [Cannabis sativa]
MAPPGMPLAPSDSSSTVIRPNTMPPPGSGSVPLNSHFHPQLGHSSYQSMPPPMAAASSSLLLRDCGDRANIGDGGNQGTEQSDPWTAHKTETGVVYYYNALTGGSTYDKPPDFKERRNDSSINGSRRKVTEVDKD